MQCAALGSELKSKKANTKSELSPQAVLKPSVFKNMIDKKNHCDRIKTV